MDEKERLEIEELKKFFKEHPDDPYVKEFADTP